MIHNFSAQQSCILENMLMSNNNPKKKKKQQLGDSVLPLILGQRGLSTSICIHLASTSDSFGIEEKSK